MTKVMIAQDVRHEDLCSPLAASAYDGLVQAVCLSPYKQSRPYQCWNQLRRETIPIAAVRVPGRYILVLCGATDVVAVPLSLGLFITPLLLVVVRHVEGGLLTLIRCWCLKCCRVRMKRSFGLYSRNSARRMLWGRYFRRLGHSNGWT